MFVFVCFLKDLTNQRKAWFWGGLWRLRDAGRVKYISKECGDLVKFYCFPDSFANLEHHLNAYNVKHIKKHLPS